MLLTTPIGDTFENPCIPSRAGTVMGIRKWQFIGAKHIRQTTLNSAKIRTHIPLMIPVREHLYEIDSDASLASRASWAPQMQYLMIYQED